MAGRAAARGGLATALGFLPYATGAVLGVWRVVLEELYGFDETLTYAGDDVDLCWRAQLASRDLEYAADAWVGYRYRVDLRATLFQAYRNGRGNVELFMRYRDQLTRPPLRHLVLAYGMLARGALDLARGRQRRGAWLGRLCNRASRLVGSARARVLYP